MSAVVSAILVMLCSSLCVYAQSQTLTLFSTSNRGLDSVASHVLQQELQRLLVPADIQIAWEAGREHVSKPSELLVVISFEGNCSVADLSKAAILPGRANVLGETAVQRPGKILPLFKVHCDRVIQTLRPMLDLVSVVLRQSVLGRALGRIIAHEIYHILAQTTEHDAAGVAKAAFSTEDLMAEQFGFEPSSLERMPKTMALHQHADVVADLEEVPRRQDSTR